MKKAAIGKLPAPPAANMPADDERSLDQLLNFIQDGTAGGRYSAGRIVSMLAVANVHPLPYASCPNVSNISPSCCPQTGVRAKRGRRRAAQRSWGMPGPVATEAASSQRHPPQQAATATPAAQPAWQQQAIRGRPRQRQRRSFRRIVRRHTRMRRSLPTCTAWTTMM